MEAIEALVWHVRLGLTTGVIAWKKQVSFVQ
jgi:hypothetical protein